MSTLSERAWKLVASAAIPFVLHAQATCQRAPVVPAPVWTELGPAPIASGPYTGRVAAIATSASDANLYYVGGADGGVWRTEDGGVSWRAVGDGLPTTAVGALALDPQDHDVVYVGTGEANFANHCRYGLGFARSRDGGQTWSVSGEQAFAGRCFSRIRVDPQNRTVLYAGITHAGGFPARAAARNHPLANGPLGVFKSTDAGATWVQLAGGLPTTVSATDVALDPQNPQVVYVAVGDIFGNPANGVYKSTDGGATFVELGGGLPTANVGRITLAIAPSQTSTIVASVVRACDAVGNNGATLNVYRSTDAGASWSAINPGSYQATYGWYLCTSAIAPASPSTILVGGLELRRTTNAGGSWSTVTPPHVDIHALEFDAAGRLLCGDDGGIHRSSNFGTSWQAINGNLGLVQFYAGISLDPSDPTVVYGGSQDNGTLMRDAGGWVTVLGGDGGYTSIDSTGTRVFAEFQGTGNLYASINGGSFQPIGTGLTGRNCFLPPHEVHPLDPLLMIYGTERLFRSTNGGNTWSPVSPDLTGGGSAAISGLAFAPSDANTVYVLTNDGRVQTTANGGQSWQLRLTGIATWPRTRRPFAVHPGDPRQVWLAVAGFGGEKLLASESGGADWFAATGDLPDLPANAVAVHTQPAGPPIVYLGTDQGVWRSEDSGKHWSRYGVALPNAPVIDLRADAARGRLVAATQGRGLWEATLSPRAVAVPPRQTGN
jgi:photosystem II stability/assembly factor-like uncharacterized protein